MVVPPAAVPLLARCATGSANAALDGPRGRPHGRAVVIWVRIRGARARREKGIGGRAGVAPGPSARVALIGLRIFRTAGTGGVVADAVVDGCWAGRTRAEEVDGAAGRVSGGRTDDGEGVAEDIAHVEVAGRVGLEDGAVGVGAAIGAHVGDADLAVEAGAEVSAAGCGTGVGVVVKGVVGVLGVAGPGDGETVGAVAGSAGYGEDLEGSDEEGEEEG